MRRIYNIFESLLSASSHCTQTFKLEWASKESAMEEMPDFAQHMCNAVRLLYDKSFDVVEEIHNNKVPAATRMFAVDHERYFFQVCIHFSFVCMFV